MDTQEILNHLNEIVLAYGPRLIGAIVIWIIGWRVIKVLTKEFRKMLDKREVDKSLKPFLAGIIATLLKVMLVISLLSMLGVEMTSLIAILGAVGLAVGLALSGTLQNFAGGVMLLIFKPFKVGDVINAQGFTGTVNEIQIFNTILKTPDNKTIILPNGSLSTSAMTNYSTEEKRRVDWTIGIGYGDDASKAEQVIKKLCDEDERIIKDPEVFIAISPAASLYSVDCRCS